MFNGMQVQNRSSIGNSQSSQAYQNAGFMSSRDNLPRQNTGNTPQSSNEEFTEFQSSGKKPENKSDAWSMGKGLFTLDLKADSIQKMEKQKSTNDDLLFTKNHDMNAAWNQPNQFGKMPSYPTGGASFYTANTSNPASGFGGYYNSNPMGGPSMSPGYGNPQQMGQRPPMQGNFGAPSQAFGFTNPSASQMPNTVFTGAAGGSNFGFMSGNLGAGGNQRGYGGSMM